MLGAFTYGYGCTCAALLAAGRTKMGACPCRRAFAAFSVLLPVNECSNALTIACGVIDSHARATHSLNSSRVAIFQLPYRVCPASPLETSLRNQFSHCL